MVDAGVVITREDDRGDDDARAAEDEAGEEVHVQEGRGGEEGGDWVGLLVVGARETDGDGEGPEL